VEQLIPLASGPERPAPVCIPNDGELPLQEATAGPFAWRYAYARASERRATEKVGQDYLCFQVADDRFAFALCDGVGQSYFGDLAARLLGDALLDWLWTAPSKGGLADDLGETLTTWLTGLTDAGTAAVAAHESTSALAPLVAQVLERKRADGSATTMTGARIELTDTGWVRLMLVALGDSRLRVWVEGTEITVHSAASQVGHGWSTRRGIVGGPPSLSLFNSRVRAVRILAYTDGLTALDPVPDQIGSADLQRTIEESQADPASDDIAVLDVWLRNVEAGPGTDQGSGEDPDNLATLRLPRFGAHIGLDPRSADEPLVDDPPTLLVVPPIGRGPVAQTDAAPAEPLAPPDDAEAGSSVLPNAVRSFEPDAPEAGEPVAEDEDEILTPGPIGKRPQPRGLPTRRALLLVVVIVVLVLLVVLFAVRMVMLAAPVSILAPTGGVG
jgi:hypothetical protein